MLGPGWFLQGGSEITYLKRGLLNSFTCLDVFEFKKPGSTDWKSAQALSRRSRLAQSLYLLDVLQYQICMNLNDFKKIFIGVRGNIKF